MRVPNQNVFEIAVIVHNLMINPNDVPNYNETVFNEYGNQLTYTSEGWQYENDYGVYDAEPPRLWYDIPNFDMDTADLESKTREELIQIILKERGEK